MRYHKFSFGVVCALVLLMLANFCTAAKGQTRPYRLSDKQVTAIMRRLKNDTGRFRKSLDSALDKSRLDGTNREDDINAFMKDYEKSTDQLYDRFKDHKSVSGDVESVLDRATRIDRFMTRHAFGGRAERDWSVLRQDLRRLAGAYSVNWRWW